MRQRTSRNVGGVATAGFRERLARRLEQQAHLRKAGQAVAAGGQLRTVVNRRRMARANVTALTEHRELRHKHAIVVGPVRVVTRVARFPHRRVVPACVTHLAEAHGGPIIPATTARHFAG